ncbi:sigma-70 family RNA polymerase sigma factor [Streptomyces sp. NBC_00083]|uniref:sigma-70 family RNA polymerase sigma factor n=1 Tax=Streptomyces sp. NBC_00083 TaxID=2975647 RepID=UPI0022598159|nr:sigma-70 family RNA polymerase sigma factor [Streptomyces sp. NBC_00083]MCX5383508.1 sigma-70 family RNA polymerase sigma factor [Streptomyces sp. NBC_00083]
MDLVAELSPLLAAEAAAEASGTGIDAADLEQAVWLRLLEQRPGDLRTPARWVRTAVRAEARRARWLRRQESPYAGERAADPDPGPELAAISAERRRVLRAAIGRTPGNCPRLLTALLSPADPTYREIAGELDISQGSLGPMRSRCLGCLRRMLAAEVAAPERGGKER